VSWTLVLLAFTIHPLLLGGPRCLSGEARGRVQHGPDPCRGLG
jgi:hypothetical protein